MVVQRERLHALIDARLPGAVWLQGPTGAGKTVLLRSYLQRDRCPSIWLSADERHRDPAALFAAITAVAQVHCDGALPAFSPEHRDEPDAFARGYFTRLDQGVPQTFAFVIDDLHELVGTTAPLLAFAIDAFDGRRRACFASQLMPDPGFALQLATSRLWIVGHKQLAFDLDEARGLATRVGSSADALDALVHATDGWAAGLMLAMQFGSSGGTGNGSDDPLQGVRTPLALLIASQVLGGLAPSDLARLRMLAELPQVPVEIGDLLPDWSGACMRLQAMSERGLFVERLAVERSRVSDPAQGIPRIARAPKGCWRLHDLLRGALREQGTVDAFDGALGDALTATLVQIDRIDLAWQLAVRIGAAALTDLVVRHGRSALQDSHATAMVQVTAPHATRNAPHVALWQARAQLGNDNFAALACCEEAYRGFEDRNDAAGTSLSASLALFIIFAAIDQVGEVSRWAERMTRVTRLGSDDASGADEHALALAAEVVHDMLIASRIASRDEAAALQDRLLAHVLAQTLTPNENVLAGSLLVAAMKRLNRRSEVEQVIVRIEALNCFERSAPHMQATWKLENGYHFSRMASFAQARASFTDALRIADQNSLQQTRIATLIGLVRLELTVGDLATSRTHLDLLDEVGAARLGRLNGWVIHLQARHAICVGNVARALAQLDLAETLIREAGFPDSAQLLLDMDRVQALYGTRHWADCEPIAERIEGIGSPNDREQARVVLALLEAHALWKTDRPSAEPRLRSAIAQAERLELVLFVPLLPRVAGEIASMALAIDAGSEFVLKAIRARGLPAPADAPANWPWPCRIETFGLFRMSFAGAVQQSSGKAQQKPLELLKFLACERDMLADFASIAAALWPDAEASAARKSLEVTVSRLRKLLEDDSMVIVKEGKVSLDASRISSDAKEFFAVSLEAEALIARRESPTVVGEIADRLLRLFRGLPLDHEEPTAWREEVRERCRNAFVRAVRSITQYWGEANDPVRAIALLEAAISREPLAETLYQQLMRIYIKQDQSAEAMRVYRQCRQMLSILIGQPPSADTERIKDLIHPPR